ncbi:MAG: hypothetical protein ACP5MK_02185 [Candidatus Micrarchaeia archaeon]
MWGISTPLFSGAKGILAVAKSKRAQGSLEYIMMLAAASIVIAIALAMIVKLKGAAVTSVSVNGTNESIAHAISGELGSLIHNTSVV